MSYFDDLGDYKDYIGSNGLEDIFNVDDVNVIGDDPSSKVPKGLYDSVDPSVDAAYEIEWDDIVRLHYLVRSRRVTTILEFGVGKSTVALAHALGLNKRDFGEYVQESLRRSNAFEIHTVDNHQYWIDHVRASYGANVEGVSFHCAKLIMGSFSDRICTYYDALPNICPDLIYLDGPDQFSVQGEIRGITTASPDRMPMAADILGFEHFLVPGTLIVIDGRTANARFLKCNLQRDWKYIYLPEYDQHFFELTEEPLGPYSAKHLKFMLG